MSAARRSNSHWNFFIRKGIAISRPGPARPRRVFNSPVSHLNLLNTQKNAPFHLNLHFRLQFGGVQIGFQMGNDSPLHLSPNLHFNLKIEMPKRKLRSEMGLLNSLQVSLESLFDSKGN